MSDDDRALIAEIRSGSEHAFNMLAQDTFLAAWTHARSFRGEANVRTWLCGIAWRKAKAAQRSWFRRRARDAAYNERPSADIRSASMEDRVAVRDALLALPLQQRAALTLCLVCGFSHSEAAAIIGAPVGTVKSHVLRGRERLREAMEKHA
jgi:RNA polymerase sigma-70 factor (ECF subfamily)